jgi:hypothetical protein
MEVSLQEEELHEPLHQCCCSGNQSGRQTTFKHWIEGTSHLHLAFIGKSNSV